MRACENELATITVSPLGTGKRPVQGRRRNAGQQRRLAVAARDRQRRGLHALGVNAPAMKRRCQASTVSGSPARRPWVTVSVPR